MQQRYLFFYYKTRKIVFYYIKSIHFEKLGIAIPENDEGTIPYDRANSEMIEALRTRF